MMVAEEDRHFLGLSLSLSSAPRVDRQRVLDLMPGAAAAAAAAPAPPRTQYWSDFFSCERKACHEMPFLRGIDVNRVPAGAAAERENSEDEEAGASSPNSTLSSLSGKRGLPARSGGEQETERGGGSDDEDGADTGAGGSRKKLRLSKDQSAVLEESFKEHNTLNPKQKLALAKQLNLKARQVEVWFQNRRARTKLKQTEVDCEFLKRCCESLTEENRRLQKEVQELRALKLVSPHLYMHMAPPTTLTMCPSCERVHGGVPKAEADTGRTPLHRPVPVPAAAGMGLGPWGPVPGRPMFVDGPVQRS